MRRTKWFYWSSRLHQMFSNASFIFSSLKYGTIYHSTERMRALYFLDELETVQDEGLSHNIRLRFLGICFEKVCMLCSFIPWAFNKFHRNMARKEVPLRKSHCATAFPPRFLPVLPTNIRFVFVSFFFYALLSSLPPWDVLSLIFFNFSAWRRSNAARLNLPSCSSYDFLASVRL